MPQDFVLSEAMLHALIAGGSALLGAAIGQISPLLLSWLDARRERSRIRRERFEEIAQLGFDLQVEVIKLALHPMNEAAVAREMSRITGRMTSLSIVYFDEMRLTLTPVLNTAWTILEDIRVGMNAEDRSSHIQAFHAASNQHSAAISRYRKRYV